MNKEKLKKLFKHLVYMACLSVTILYLFFYIVLPYITHQGKIVQVPDLTGIHLDALDEKLSKDHLHYVITDSSGYSAQLPPFTVLQQFPAAGAWVKENRKIYLTLNAENPPLVSMPSLIERSVRHAGLLLKNKGLKLGNIKYVPDVTEHAVLEQWHNGHPIAAGKPIHKGSIIDLVVSAGLGNRIIEVPNLIDMDIEEAKLLLLEQGMRIEVSDYVKSKKTSVGTIISQKPALGSKVPLGTPIHVSITKV
ncbi:MAG: PASTA domain-containing protein [Candidatus Cardinium sp.]|uniref:PASTA domain-containing protein n=1 Tax=Cardinium endosymbiont of Dermatophagoides farinae TaxID=2597823 RepID=UPI001181E76A|nr:PASTA domain-containing protein [Cardinium endosymbiont of Dermatophagoides farinae]TSJ80620.1 PASTA domain-containing protein [Cardinium endosymbiont of Dermatophagoides farinae]UWW96612.1 MAG: PASTA domain-containing protein [Candidatus Cardinium sp.]